MIIKMTNFTQYELTEEERVRGYSFNREQRAIFSNALADAAIARACLIHDPSNPMATLLEDAALVGQIKLLNFFLSNSQPTTVN